MTVLQAIMNKLQRIVHSKDKEIFRVKSETRRHKTKCEICGKQYRYYTHFVIKKHGTKMMPLKIYRLCGGKECQSKALKQYMKIHIREDV